MDWSHYLVFEEYSRKLMLEKCFRTMSILSLNVTRKKNRKIKVVYQDRTHTHSHAQTHTPNCMTEWETHKEHTHTLSYLKRPLSLHLMHLMQRLPFSTKILVMGHTVKCGESFSNASDLQCPPLNRITSGQHKCDNNKRMILLTSGFWLLIRHNGVGSIWLQ